MSFFSKIKRIKKRASSPYAKYLKDLELPLFEDRCLLEAGQGKNINGNMFALARTIARDPDFAGIKIAYVVTADTQEAAENRLQAYSIHNAELVIRNSARYKEMLARSKFLFTDNSFPPYFIKRTDQIYVNTWHGTPLKHLGHGDLSNAIASLANVQKNMLSADYVVFPNELTKMVFWEDYQLKTLFSHHYLMCDYPRNDAMMDDGIAAEVRRARFLENKRLIAYMPTWRGAKRSADVEEQKGLIRSFLNDIDAKLGDDDLLYVNLHFLVTGGMDFSAYTHIRPFPEELETYDFLAACDILVTDYSSVFFDFACTGKKIVLFAYDKEEYLENKGTYIPYDSLPFPIAETVDELIPLITSDSYAPYHAFQTEYCKFATGHASHDLLELVIHGNHLAIQPHENSDAIDHTLLFTSNSRRIAFNDIMLRELPDLAQAKNPLLVCGGKSNGQTVNLLQQLSREMPYMAIVTSRVQTPSEKIMLALASRSRLFQTIFRSRLATLSARELDRIFPGVKINFFVDLNANASYLMKLFAFSTYSRKGVLRDGTLTRVAREKQTKQLLKQYEVVRSNIAHDRSSVSPDGATNYFNAGMSATLVTKHYSSSRASYSVSGFMRLRLARNMNLKHLSLAFEDGRTVGFVAPFGPFKQLRRYRIDIPRAELPQLPIHNWIILSYKDGEVLYGRKRIRFNKKDGARSKSKVGALFIDQATSTTSYYRQGARNTLCFTTRDTISIDAPKERIKLHLAHAITSIVPVKRHAIVLYEKNASRYEESASVVYEKLLDTGHGNAYFILNRESKDRDKISARYRKNIVEKNSLLHYILFFAAETFIGTEMLAHSIDVRPANQMVSRRLSDKTINYVFLQHGVMYMLSLNSSSRTFFRPKKLKGIYRVVVSSELEKQHFVDLGGYNPETLYVCGLPKFDRNTWDESADVIAIMPTWRPWEYNLARTSFEETGYYKFIQTVIDSVPEQLRSNILVLPHPLFAEAVHHEDFPLKQYFDDGTESYDSILRRTKLLITDYSSIAYDAFYRGANVLFYWKDKEECLEHYGKNSEIMIDVDTAFGDVCFDQDAIPRAVIERNYRQAQTAEHQLRYSRIVSFHDGHNTDRLMDLLKQDGLI